MIFDTVFFPLCGRYSSSSVVSCEFSGVAAMQVLTETRTDTVQYCTYLHVDTGVVNAVGGVQNVQLDKKLNFCCWCMQQLSTLADLGRMTGRVNHTWY